MQAGNSREPCQGPDSWQGYFYKGVDMSRISPDSMKLVRGILAYIQFL